jgi:hypothetical protein
MSKNDWRDALNRETKSNAEFAYRYHYLVKGLYTSEYAMSAASVEFQQATKARRKTQRASANRSVREDAMRSCGLTKVYGAVSGKVYWE